MAVDLGLLRTRHGHRELDAVDPLRVALSKLLCDGFVDPQSSHRVQHLVIDECG